MEKNKNNNLNRLIAKCKGVVSSKGFLYVVILFLLMANVSLFYFSDNSSKNENGLFFLNPARKFFKQEDLIINVQPVRDYLNEKYEADENVSIYFEYLNTGANISISKDAEFFPASLLKLPVAMAVAKKIEKGQWKWDNELVLMRNDKDELFGDLYKESIGTTFSVERLVNEMLVHSDNTAYRILLRNLEPEELDDVHDHLGLQEFFSSDGKISAKRYSIIFRSLYNSSYLSEENSQKILLLLSQTPFDEYIKSGLPANVGFSHKIGVSDEHGVFMDSGIVYEKGRPYLLTVMIKTDNQQDALAKMKDISSVLFEYVSKYKGE